MTKKKNFHRCGIHKKALLYGQARGMGPFSSRRPKRTKKPFVTKPDKEATHEE